MTPSEARNAGEYIVILLNTINKMKAGEALCAGDTMNILAAHEYLGELQDIYKQRSDRDTR